MHKLTILFLRIWMSILSVGAFLFGWVVFGHSAKPAPLGGSAPASGDTTANNGASSGGASAGVQLTPLPTLAPLPAIGQSSGGQLQQLPSVNLAPPVSSAPSNFFARPRLMTRGS